MHMPGHKGKPGTGPEADDITEIRGADELYCPRGIIRESEENAAALFGAARTVYSAEGSSLCIRAMLYLACLRAVEKGIPCRILAGRNAHRTLVSAAALLNLEIDWVYPGSGEGLLSCAVSTDRIVRALDEKAYMAVYLTTPDYLGGMIDLAGIAAACRKRNVPLLVDNAHGAYLKFLRPDRHPLTLGADVCCDSAHKTLPCLTGAAYLHFSRKAPEDWRRQAEQALAMFGSTSPSYLILQSLDHANALLAGDYPEKLQRAAEKTQALKGRLSALGWAVPGSEPMKLTIDAASGGYTGEELREALSAAGIECEFSDPDAVVLMPSAETGAKEWAKLEKTLEGILLRSPIVVKRPEPARAERVMSIRQALMSPREELPAEQAAGRVLADAYMGCPPAVPILIAGERITESAVLWFRYYGITTCMVVREQLPEKLEKDAVPLANQGLI